MVLSIFKNNSIFVENRKVPQVYGFRLVGFDAQDLEDVTIKVHHNCDSSLLEICSHDEECVDEGASCKIPSAKTVDVLNIGKRMQGLARCLCDEDHKIEYLGMRSEINFRGLKGDKNPASKIRILKKLNI